LRRAEALSNRPLSGICELIACTEPTICDFDALAKEPLRFGIQSGRPAKVIEQDTRAGHAFEHIQHSLATSEAEACRHLHRSRQMRCDRVGG
jgi:hypothetical protein